MKRRHIVLAFLFGLGLITFLDRICYSVAGKRIMADLDLDPAQFGSTHSFFILAYGLFQMPLGALADKFGARFVVAAIVLWWSVFTGLTGLAESFATLLAIRFLFGAGEAGAYPAMSGIVSRWFPISERARAQGIIWGASRLGGALSPLLVVPIQQRYGWRAGFYLLAGVGLLWTIAWWFSYRNRPEAARRIRPEEIAEINAGKTAAAKVVVPWRKLLSSPQLWIIGLMYFCYVWASWFYFTWMPTYLEKGRHFPEDEMKLYAALPFILGTGSNVLGGFLSDTLSARFGPKIGRLAIGTTSLTAGGICLFITATVPDSQRWAIVGALALGFGLTDLMLPSAWAICLDVGQKYAGTVSGAMNTFGSIGGFLCAELFGRLVKHSGNYNQPLMVIAGMLLCSAILFSRIDPTRPLVAETESKPIN